MNLSPFTIDIPQPVPNDLAARLTSLRFPNGMRALNKDIK